MPHKLNYFALRSKSHQREHILRLLREAKLRGEGVRKADLLFGHRYTQCATRIFELEERGFEIEHRSVPGEKFVVFFLISEPAKSSDWYEHTTGRPRPRLDKDESSSLPLFRGLPR